MRMPYRLGIIAFTLTVSFFCCVMSGYAQEKVEPVVTAGFDLTFVSKYIWRGQPRYDDFAFQPEAYIGFANVEFDIFASMDTSDRDGMDTAGEFTEVDVKLDYKFGWNTLNFNVGGIYYDYPKIDVDSTIEVYGKVGLDMVLHPTFELYWDVDEAEGLYARVSGSSDLAIGMFDCQLKASLGLGSKGYNDYYFDVNDMGLNDFTVELSAAINLFGEFSLRPFIGLSILLNDEIRDAVDEADNIFIGATLSWGF